MAYDQDDDEVDYSNPVGMQLFPTKTATGSEISLMTAAEAQWYSDRRDQYMEANHFVNVSDLLDLDRLLMMEAMVYRWSAWLGQGFDYHGAFVNEKELKESLGSFSTEIRQLKKALGIDKVGRDAAKGEDVASFIMTLGDRAREFGVHRNMQYELAVTLLYEIQSKVLTYWRADDRERRELGLSAEGICEWLRDDVAPEWEGLAADYRKEQRIWIKDL